MSPEQIKIIFAAIGIGCAVVGGYYFIEALTNESVPLRETIWRELKKEGYTKFLFEDEKWEEKFKKFDDKSDIDLPELLKNNEKDKGGESLKEWCNKILDLEKEKITRKKTIQNARSFCVERTDKKQ